MVESEKSPDNYKTLKISIGVIIKNLVKLKLVPDHLRIKKTYKNAVKKLPFLTMYVPN